jgi:transcriptional regulator with XRE-family HTH domain
LATPAKPATQAAPPAVGAQLAKLREERGWSLDSLSQRAGVSKSMLSQIERAQANPTVAVVWRLANALGVPLLELLQPDKAASPEAAVTVVPAGRSPTLRTGDDLGELQILGPIETAGHFEWYHLKLKAGGALSSQPHEPGTREHLTVLSGTLEVSAGSAVTKVAAGETARYPADVSHSIRNPGRATATALLVVMHTD